MPPWALFSNIRTLVRHKCLEIQQASYASKILFVDDCTRNMKLPYSSGLKLMNVTFTIVMLCCVWVVGLIHNLKKVWPETIKFADLKYRFPCCCFNPISKLLPNVATIIHHVKAFWSQIFIFAKIMVIT